MIPRGARGRSTWVLLLLAVGVLVGACASSEVRIKSAIVSQDDMRLRLTLSSCNAELEADVVETQAEVVVTVTDIGAPLIALSGKDCLDMYIVELAGPFADRRLTDGTTRSPVSASKPPADAGPPWPYDRNRFSEADYLKALDATVACLERTDPEMDAWIFQDLDWKTYRWHKEPDESGNRPVGPTLDACRKEHLDPLK